MTLFFDFIRIFVLSYAAIGTSTLIFVITSVLIIRKKNLETS